MLTGHSNAAGTSHSNKGLLNGCRMLLFASTIGAAEIYKWVDENGRTHYSEREENDGKTKALELKIKHQPASAHVISASPQYWQEQERQFQQRQAEKERDEQLRKSRVETAPKPLSDGTENGTPTDAHD